MLELLLLLLLCKQEQQLLLLLLLLLELAQHIALAAGRCARVGTIVGLLALQSALLLAPTLASTCVLAVRTGAVVPLAISSLIKWWRNGGIARPERSVEVGELGKCRRI